MLCSHRGILLTKFSSRFLCSSSARFSSSKTENPQEKNAHIVESSISSAENLASKYNKHIQSALVRWNKCHEIYFGQERDMVNYPTIKIPDLHPKVRLGFIPDSWFQMLYSRTGVTGPYLFLAGTTTFLLSKEIWVVDGHFMEVIPFVLIMTWMIKKFGARTTEYVYNMTRNHIDHFYTNPMKKAVSNLDKTIQSADVEIARAKCVPALFTAKRENLELQLEVAYRERLQKVYKTVTRRLDYHVERENVRRRFQQLHMSNWVTSSVVSGISSVQEKETLRQCIEDLKMLAANHKKSLATV